MHDKSFKSTFYVLNSSVVRDFIVRGVVHGCDTIIATP